MSALLRLFLIRHGETEWARSGQHTGHTDIPLTAHGEEEARQLKHAFKGLAFARVLTSPLLRAKHTCELAGLGEVAKTDPDLAEWDYGEYEGKRSAEIRVTRPDWNVFRDGCPGGEMPPQVSARVDRLIAQVAALEGNVALFSHGHLGCLFATRWIGLPVVEAQHFSLQPASFSILTFARNHPEVRVIGLWNATPALMAGQL